MKVLVETQSGQSFSIFVQDSDTIDVIEWKIEVKMGIHADDHFLTMDTKMPVAIPPHMTMSEITDKTEGVVIYSQRKRCRSQMEDDAVEKSHAALAKQMVNQYDRVAADLLSFLRHYREWRRDAMKLYRNKFTGEPEMEIEKVSYSKIPLATYAVGLLPLLDIQTWFNPDLRDPTLIPRQLDLLKEAIKEWLSQVDENIQGNLSPKSWQNKSTGDGLSAIYLDDDKCTAVAELLMLNKNWPSRMQLMIADIATTTSEELTLETESPGTASAFGGSLREQVVLCKVDFLTSAVDMFLQVLEICLSKETFSEVLVLGKPATKTIKAFTHLIFDLIDLDGDGDLSQEESLEFCRVLLTRASLGRLLMNCVCEKAAHHSMTDVAAIAKAAHDLIEKAAHDLISPTTVPVARTSLMSVTPSVLLTFAEGLESISLNLWLAMDFDKDGTLTKAEFCEHFPQAFWKTILVPLVGRLEEKSAELTPKKADVNDALFLPLPVLLPKNLPNMKREGYCGFSRNCSYLPEHLFGPPTNKHATVGPSAAVHETRILPPLTNRQETLDTSAKPPKELADSDEFKIQFDNTAEGYLVSENLDVDEACLTECKVEGSSNYKASCMPKRTCLPKQPHNHASGQPRSGTLNASCEKANKRENAACNVM